MTSYPKRKTLLPASIIYSIENDPTDDKNINEIISPLQQFYDIVFNSKVFRQIQERTVVETAWSGFGRVVGTLDLSSKVPQHTITFLVNVLNVKV